jgi:tetratricopeptide (TPR) repeat protein
MEDALLGFSDVLKLGQDTEDRLLQIAGCIRGLTLMYMGRPHEAIANLRAGIALCREDDDFMGAGFSENYAVTLRQWLGWALWLVGETEESRQNGEAAITVARRTDGFNLAYALMFAAAIALLRDDVDHASRLAEEAHALASKEHFDLVVALSAMERAAVRGLQGDAREAGEAADAIVASIGVMGESGNRSGAGLILSFLARLQLRAGRPRDAEGTVRLALAMSPETGAFFDAELVRIRAEIAHADGDLERAADDLDEAMRIARDQGARGFEPRIAASRGRLAGVAGC